MAYIFVTPPLCKIGHDAHADFDNHNNDVQMQGKGQGLLKPGMHGYIYSTQVSIS